MNQEKIQAIKEFEKTKDYAELKALSEISLTRELTDLEFKRMMELKPLVDGLI